MENYFNKFRVDIIGNDLTHPNQSGQILYADWTASGRLYRPIENQLTNEIGPYVANPHTENTHTGRVIGNYYKQARQLIKRHVNASDDYALINCGAGATSAIVKLQRLLNLTKSKSNSMSKKQPAKAGILGRLITFFRSNDKNNLPVVFVSHMEHHSNHTSWNTCDVDVVVIKRGLGGQPCYDDLEQQLKSYQSRKVKIGAFTACSNVTGIHTNVRRLARTMHLNGGVCFIDYACSAPYVDIDMMPSDPLEHIDAIYFSPHKFLGGPGSAGVLVFNKKLYQLSHTAPDKPGGGTVKWTNPWGQQAFFEDIERREDGGTPPFLQVIKTAKAIELKEQMGVANIQQRESELLQILFDGLAAIPSLSLLEPEVKQRLCIVSFYIEGLHHNLIVRLLDDKFGIQSRGGCSCAGTYGHTLLNVSQQQSQKIVNEINRGNLSNKPGWVRISLHPTNTDNEALFIVQAIEQIVLNADAWSDEYRFVPQSGDFEREIV